MADKQTETVAPNAAHVTLSLLAVAVIALVAWQFYAVYREGTHDDGDEEPISLGGRAG